MSIEIPAGLTELLQGFTVEVLRHQPPDLLEFALQHFTRLQQENERKGSARPGHEGKAWVDAGAAAGGGTPSKGVNFAEEPMHTDSENGEPEEEEEAAADTVAFNGEHRDPLRAPSPYRLSPLCSNSAAFCTHLCPPSLPSSPARPPPQHPFLSFPFAHLSTPLSCHAFPLRPLLWRWGLKATNSLPVCPLRSRAERPRTAGLGWASARQLSRWLEDGYHCA